MRIRAAVAALPILVIAIGAAACTSNNSSSPTASTTAGSSASASDGSAASGSESPSGSSSSAAATLGPAVPPATTVAAAVDKNLLPTATGTFGQKPTLTFPSSTPPPSLQRETLSEGTGPAAAAGDWLTVNYLGQIWGGKVFDNSYDKKTTFPFQIGGQVVSGWSVGLTGVKEGSRVLLSLPPADGYGASGNSGAGISGTDTIVFVIDVVKVYKSTDGGQKDAVVQKLPAGLPTVTGAPGSEPKISVGSAAAPSGTKAYVIAKGTGPAVVEGNILAQLVVTDWAGSQTSSTWGKASATDTSQKGLTELQVVKSTASAPSPTGDLVGIPVGSRVLLLLPATTDSSTGQQQSAAAAVIDIVAQVSTGS
jgi:peptidylprolyl isomerase